MDVNQVTTPEGKVEYRVSSNRTAIQYTVRSGRDGLHFWHIYPDRASLPASLCGRFSTHKTALDSLNKHLHSLKDPNKKTVKKVVLKPPSEKKEPVDAARANADNS